MSEYKRLTIQNDFEDFCENVFCPHKYIEELGCSVEDCDNCYYKQIYTRLAELEDKIESGEFGDITAERHRAEVAERKAKYIDNAFHSQMLKIALDHKYAKEFIKFTLGTITRIYEEAVENAIKQAEKELQEERK